MEAAVTKLEVMFQKAESDLDYIQHKLEFEVKKSLPDDSSGELSPLTKEEQTAIQQLQSHSTCQTSGGIDLHKTTLM
uniref:Protein FAM33A n=1 Tax=Sarcophilus harrisii TaxID=9305 RepID=A0A7N4NYI5_SARHA